MGCKETRRRDWLKVGSLGALGLSLPDLLASQTTSLSKTETPSGQTFGRAKSCIVLFMFGAPAHQDIWDLKPDAPREIRGEFRPIASRCPDTFVGEHIPRLAQMSDRYTIVRSMSHPDNTHTVAMHYMLTGVRHQRPTTNPQNAPDDFPCLGAVTNFAQQQHLLTPLSATSRHRVPATPPTTLPHNQDNSILPSSVSLNAPANQVSANNWIFPGFFSGFLGRAYDPLFIEQHANSTSFEPFPTVQEESRLPARRNLLSTFDLFSRHLHQRKVVSLMDHHYDRALDLLTSQKARHAFNLTQEPESLREQYGRTPFGQGCLLARRLIESGVRLVTVNWERDDAYWDTHSNNFSQLKNQLLPNFDQGFSTLLEDLHQRGLDSETLVVCLGEFGRTPTINANAGRDHWAACNSIVLAGAGIDHGKVYGRSDRNAAYPVRNLVAPSDLSATIYHLLGIDYQYRITGPDNRSLPLSNGKPLYEILNA